MTDQPRPDDHFDDTEADMTAPMDVTDAPYEQDGDPTRAGMFGDDVETEYLVAADVEETLLVALMWSPRSVARHVCAAVDARHLVSPVHQSVMAAISAVAQSTDPSPQMVNAHLLAAGAFTGAHGQQVRSVMVALAAPADRPVAGADAIAPIAVAVIDGWYRRGYAGLLARMSQHRDELPVEELAGAWAQLTMFQQRAEQQWLTRRHHLTCEATTIDCPTTESGTIEKPW